MHRWLQAVKNSTLLKIRLFLALILVSVILSLLLAKIVPGGSIFYDRDYSQNYFGLGGQGFLSLFSPAERVDSLSDKYPRLLADPIYFSLFTPRRFDRAKLTIRYQDKLSDKTPIIEAGVLKDKAVWSYQMEPVENKILDSLAWNKSSQQSTTLYQRQGRTADLDYFLKSAADRSDLALYNYSLNRPFRPTSYQARQSAQVVAAALRSSYKFYTYIDQESLNFTFYFQDLNQNYDLKGDGISIVVSRYNGEKILEQTVTDDGIIVDNGNLSPQKVSSFNLKDLPTGVYRVEVKANDDIITKKIVSTQTKISFVNKLWLEDSDIKSLEVYTNSDYIKATAFGAAGLQTLSFQDRNFKIDVPFQQFNFQIKNNNNNEPRLIRVKPQSIIMENNGVFAFSSDALMSPDFPKIDINWVDSSEINYILADYHIPHLDGQDKLVVLDFDLSDAYREKGKYGFMISIPGLYADNQNRVVLGLEPAYLQIKEIKVELSGKSLGEKILELFKNLYSQKD